MTGLVTFRPYQLRSKPIIPGSQRWTRIADVSRSFVWDTIESAVSGAGIDFVLHGKAPTAVVTPGVFKDYFHQVWLAR